MLIDTHISPPFLHKNYYTIKTVLHCNLKKKNTLEIIPYQYIDGFLFLFYSCTHHHMYTPYLFNQSFIDIHLCYLFFCY